MKNMTETSKVPNAPYTIVFASNANGVLPLTVTAFSLVKSAKDSTIYSILVLSEGISKASQTQFTETIKRVSPRHEVRFVEMAEL